MRKYSSASSMVNSASLLRNESLIEKGISKIDRFNLFFYQSLFLDLSWIGCIGSFLPSRFFNVPELLSLLNSCPSLQLIQAPQFCCNLLIYPTFLSLTETMMLYLTCLQSQNLNVGKNATPKPNMF